MNLNTEYEKFAQSIYQEFINARGITTNVKHNVKLIGKSGQRHQIDVYWEYEINGKKHKIAIECKNHNRKLSVDKVNAFRGVLADLYGIQGIMISKKGYQAGAKKIADSCGIYLRELRPPEDDDDCRVAEVTINIGIAIKRHLFLLDDDWAKANEIDWKSYRNRMASVYFDSNLWKDDYISLSLIGRESIIDEKGKVIKTLNELEEISLQDPEYIYNFDDAYVESKEFGRVKIKSVKFLNIRKEEVKAIDLDARNVVKAILKDALSGISTLFLKDNNQP